MNLPADHDTTVTPAMQRRGLRAMADHHHHAQACAAGNRRWAEDPLPDAQVAHSMAQHRARIAWAEVEYASWLAGNRAGMPGLIAQQPQETFHRLLRAAYAATAVAHEAFVAFRAAEAARVPRRTLAGAL